MGKFKRSNHNGGKPKVNPDAIPHPAGAPSKYKEDIHPQLCHDLCKDFGYTLEDLAVHVGVPYGTLTQWWMDHVEFSDAIKSGKDIFDTQKVENKLLQRALGYEYEEKKTEEVEVRVRRRDGIIENQPAIKTTRTTKHVLPNITAAFFWLVNRSAGRWQHIQNVRIDLEGNVKSTSRVHMMDWTAIGTMMGVEKLEQLRGLLTALPAPAGSGSTADNTGGGSVPGRE